MNILRILRFVFVIGSGWKLVDPVVFARFKQLHVCIAIFNGQISHFGQLNVLGVPIAGTLGQNNLAVDLPVLQTECTIANHVGRLGPLFAKLLNSRLVHGSQLQVGNQIRHEANRERGLDFKCVGVQRFNAQFGHRHLASGNFLAVENEDAKGRRIFRCGFGVNKPSHAVNEVGCRDAIPIRPFRVVAQFENPGLRINLFPALSHAGHDFSVRVRRSQSFEQLADNVIGRNTFCQCGIKGVGF